MSKAEDKSKRPPSLDFDFSDVAGSQKKKARSKEKDILSEDNKKKEKDKKLSGIILAIPTEGGFLSKDMFDCTAEEFYEWAKRVYPMVTAEISRFESNSNKIRAFKQIQNYHYGALTQEQREAIH